MQMLSVNNLDINHQVFLYLINNATVNIFQGSTALRNSYFGNGIAPYVIYHFSCSGSESSLLQCAQYNYWYNPCFGDHKAGVVCLGIKY